MAQIGAVRFFEVLKELYDMKKPADGGSIPSDPIQSSSGSVTAPFLSLKKRCKLPQKERHFTPAYMERTAEW